MTAEEANYLPQYFVWDHVALALHVGNQVTFAATSSVHAGPSQKLKMTVFFCPYSRGNWEELPVLEVQDRFSSVLVSSRSLSEHR